MGPDQLPVDDVAAGFPEQRVDVRVEGVPIGAEEQQVESGDDWQGWAEFSREPIVVVTVLDAPEPAVEIAHR
jgi:hypothetical protein